LSQNTNGNKLVRDAYAMAEQKVATLFGAMGASASTVYALA